MMITTEAERWTLASILIEPEALLVLDLQPAHFTADARHALLYEGMLACKARRWRPSAETLRLVLGERFDQERIGALIVDLSTLAVNWSQVEVFAQRVKDAATLAQAYAIGTKLQQGALAEPLDVRAFLDTIRTDLLSINAATAPDDIEHISSAIDKLYRRFDAGVPPHLSTGWADIDHRLGGITGLTIVAGQTGMGKSAFAGQLIQHVATQQQRVLLFNLEMTDEEIAERQLAGLSGVAVSAIHRVMMDTDQLTRVVACMGSVAALPIYICTRTLTIEQLQDKARTFAYKHGGVDLIVVDYLQLVNGSSTYKGNRVQEVGHVSRGLKALNRELGCPVVALAQLTREVTKRDSKVPTVFDLRESGDIENDADMIIMLYRPGYYDPDNRSIQQRAEVHVRKNRHGPRCDGEQAILLHWDGPTNRFRDLAPYHRPEGC